MAEVPAVVDEAARGNHENVSEPPRASQNRVPESLHSTQTNISATPRGGQMKAQPESPRAPATHSELFHQGRRNSEKLLPIKLCASLASFPKVQLLSEPILTVHPSSSSAHLAEGEVRSSSVPLVPLPPTERLTHGFTAKPPQDAPPRQRGRNSPLQQSRLQNPSPQRCGPSHGLQLPPPARVSALGSGDEISGGLAAVGAAAANAAKIEYQWTNVEKQLELLNVDTPGVVDRLLRLRTALRQRVRALEPQIRLAQRLLESEEMRIEEASVQLEKAKKRGKLQWDSIRHLEESRMQGSEAAMLSAALAHAEKEGERLEEELFQLQREAYTSIDLDVGIKIDLDMWPPRSKSN